MEQMKKVNGLPDIGERHQLNKPLIVISIIMIVVVIGSMYWRAKARQVIAKPVQETYTIQVNKQVENNPEQKTMEVAPSNETIRAQPVSQEVIQQQLALIQEKQQALQQRLAAPLMLVNVNQSTQSSDTAQKTQAPSSDANTQFMNQASAQQNEAVMATRIGSLNTVIAQGSLIHAILESASNSDLPGALRASVSEPVYAEDGSQVLIPRGSRLIGQYKSGMLQGQSRIFVVWTRLITPNGISIQLGSQGVDSLGVAGMAADEINRHFWQRFGTASLLSLLGAGASNVGVNGQDQNNSAASYREAVANSFAQSAGDSLQQDSRIAPTLTTYQGKPIMVFVAKDLHFESVGKAAHSNFNIF